MKNRRRLTPWLLLLAGQLALFGLHAVASNIEAPEPEAYTYTSKSGADAQWTWEVDEVWDWTDTDVVRSFDIGYTTWSAANKKFPVTWESGLHIRGKPGERTRIIPNSKDGYLDDSTCRIDGSAKLVIFEDIEFACGTRTGPYLGITSSKKLQPRPLIVVFLNCRFVNFQGSVAKWCIMSYQTDVWLIDCDTDGELTTYEHFSYQHGFGPEGRTFLWGCAIVGRFGEIIKVTARPHALYYHPDDTPGKHATIDAIHPYVGSGLVGIYYSFLDGYAWPGAFHGGGGGAGVVLQGPGWNTNLHVKGSIISGHHGHAIGVEVMDSETFGMGGITWDVPDGAEPVAGSIANRKPGMGWVVLEDSLFLAHKDPEKSQMPPLVRVHGAAYAAMNRCGAYGDQTRVAMPEGADFPVMITACNTDAIAAQAALYGFEGAEESLVDRTHGPVSEGYLHLPGKSFSMAEFLELAR